MNTSKVRILVVDDEPDLCTLYELTLLREGYQVDIAPDLHKARALLASRAYDAVVTDMRLPDGLGMSLITEIKTQQRSERCIVITAYGSTDNAVQALKAGAFDYLTKPVDIKQFRTVIASAVQSPAAVVAVMPTQPQVICPAKGATGQQALARLVGDSACMCAVRDRILKIAPSMAPVMVTGESGTGKELVAYAIHANSHRAAGAWVAVNCGAIPENLLEAEFFGAKKGAYTGASQDRVGFFQAAGGGTLFLDEIGDLPLAMQSKLLRAIQERRVRPLGSTREEPVDVRIISATHKDLAAEVQACRFRQDLYYRLNVIDLVIAPLRDRTEDLTALCATLLARIAQESGLPPPAVTPTMVDQLSHLTLQGNVRELENLLHRAMALGDGHNLALDVSDRLPPRAVQPDTLQQALAAPDPTASPAPVAAPEVSPPALPIPDDLQRYLDDQERSILVRALQETGFNRTATAARLGLSLRQIRYRIARLAIQTPHAGDSSDGPD